MQYAVHKIEKLMGERDVFVTIKPGHKRNFTPESHFSGRQTVFCKDWTGLWTWTGKNNIRSANIEHVWTILKQNMNGASVY